IETAMREVQEETGLSVSIDQGFRKSVTYLVAPNVEKEVVYFAAIPLTSIIHRQISEIQDIQWTTFPEALNKVTFKNDRGTLLALEDYLKRS
ncbi:MAG: NUDIX domain-containing protein, partial [Bacilli bacterium]